MIGLVLYKSIIFVLERMLKLLQILLQIINEYFSIWILLSDWQYINLWDPYYKICSISNITQFFRHSSKWRKKRNNSHFKNIYNIYIPHLTPPPTFEGPGLTTQPIIKTLPYLSNHFSSYCRLRIVLMKNNKYSRIHCVFQLGLLQE